MWATTTKTLYSQNFNLESGVPDGWTQASGTLSLEVTGENKRLRETTAGSGSRGAWFTGTAIKDAIGDYTTYTLEFDCLIKEGTNTTNYSQGVWVTGSTLTQSWGAPTGYAIGVNKGSNATTYTIQANGSSTEETVNLTSNTWYHYVCSYNHSTKKITFSILSQDKSSTIYAAKDFDYDYSISGKGVFQSIAFQAGRGDGYTEIDNILLTTEVDEEVVSDPVIGVPVYAGANRTVTITHGVSSEENTVHTYYTIDGSDPTSSSNEYTSALTIYADCTLKAISISSTDIESNIVSCNITVGKLILNAPTFAMTAYSAGNYTVEITSNQANLDYVPESPVIKYSIDGGSEKTYSSAIAVPAGSTVAAHVEADNYTNSSEAEWETEVQPDLPQNWSQNYVKLVGSDVTMYYENEESAYKNCIVSSVGSNYCVYSSDGTNASANANAGFQVYYSSSSPRRWIVRPSGGMYNYTSGSAGMAIANLKAGQIVKIEWTTSSYGGLTLSSGVTKMDKISYGTVGYFEVTADGTGTAYFSAARGAYVKNITVYDITVSPTIGADGYATYSSAYALDFEHATGVKGYYTISATSGEVAMTKITGTAAANEGLFLQKTDGDISIPVVASGSTLTGNLLKATNGSSVAASAGGTYHYVFAKQNGDLGFYNMTSPLTIPAGKAYLETTAAISGARLALVFDDETTGINDASRLENSEERTVNRVVYDLQGRRVAQPAKGLYIVGGKKVIVK